MTDIKYDALTQESSILAEFEGVTNPKKVRKIATRLSISAVYDVQRRLCRDVLRAADPVAYVNLCINKIHDCALLTKQYIEDGCHGMIFTGKDGNDVFPVKLDTRKNWLEENQRWDPEQEMIIQHEAANSWMREHDKGYFYGKVVLFPTFGFSGEPRIIEMSCGDTTGMIKYPGTNFYVRKTSDVNMAESARQLHETMQSRSDERNAILDKQLREQFQMIKGE